MSKGDDSKGSGGLGLRDFEQSFAVFQDIPTSIVYNPPPPTKIYMMFKSLDFPSLERTKY